MISVLTKSLPEMTPRILFFAPCECLPANTGARLRNYHLAKALAENARVTYLCFSDGDISNPAMDSLEWCERIVSVRRPIGYSVGNLVRGAIGRWPITVLNYTTGEMASELNRLLNDIEFDAVQIESLALMAYFPIVRKARGNPIAIADWHNVDSEVFERYGRRAPSLARSAYARWTAARVRSLERKALREFDAHLTVSERDRLRLLEINPSANVFHASNGVDSDFYSEESCDRAWQGSTAQRRIDGDSFVAPGHHPKRNRILFAGSMDYFANTDAVTWFAETVWPDLHARYPELIFTIAGREPASEVRALERMPAIEVTGTVDDLRPYYREALAAVVPLRIGGGSRLKILEAMAAGVPVVSTELGAEGIEASDGENILIANTAERLSRSLSELLQDQELRLRLTTSARLLVRQRYDWSVVGEDLAFAYRSLIGDRRAQIPALVEVGA